MLGGISLWRSVVVGNVTYMFFKLYFFPYTESKYFGETGSQIRASDRYVSRLDSLVLAESLNRDISVMLHSSIELMRKRFEPHWPPVPKCMGFCPARVMGDLSSNLVSILDHQDLPHRGVRESFLSRFQFLLSNCSCKNCKKI